MYKESYWIIKNNLQNQLYNKRNHSFPYILQNILFENNIILSEPLFLQKINFYIWEIYNQTPILFTLYNPVST